METYVDNQKVSQMEPQAKSQVETQMETYGNNQMASQMEPQA